MYSSPASPSVMMAQVLHVAPVDVRRGDGRAGNVRDGGGEGFDVGPVDVRQGQAGVKRIHRFGGQMPAFHGAGGNFVGGHRAGADLIGGDGAGADFFRRYRACGQLMGSDAAGHQGTGGDGAVQDHDAVQASFQPGGVQRAGGGEQLARAGGYPGRFAVALHGKAPGENQALAGDGGQPGNAGSVRYADAIPQRQGRIAAPGNAQLLDGVALQLVQQGVGQGLRVAAAVGEQGIAGNGKPVLAAGRRAVLRDHQGRGAPGRVFQPDGQGFQRAEGGVPVFVLQCHVRLKGEGVSRRVHRLELQPAAAADDGQAPGGAGHIGQGLAQGNVAPVRRRGNPEGGVGKIGAEGKTCLGRDALGQLPQGAGVGKGILKLAFKGCSQGVEALQYQPGVVFPPDHPGDGEDRQGRGFIPQGQVHTHLRAIGGYAVRQRVVCQRQLAGGRKRTAQQGTAALA